MICIRCFNFSLKKLKHKFTVYNLSTLILSNGIFKQKIGIVKQENGTGNIIGKEKN
jgi:hypothetical protein